MLVRPDMCNPLKGVHGDTIMLLADTLGAMGASQNLPEVANGATTLESKTNFTSAARETGVAVCTPIPIGRRTSIWQTKIASKDGKSVARVTQTQLVL